MMAAAHPTPGTTLMAEKAQLRMHAPHSMQRSLSVMTALPASILNTPWGHTLVQRPHPVHFDRSYSRVVTSDRYFIFISSYTKNPMTRITTPLKTRMMMAGTA